MELRIVILGLSITSSWGNGHATTFRSLVHGLVDAGHDVLFLERDVPWYAANRDLPSPPWGRTELYSTVEELRDRFETDVHDADVVVVGSYVADGVDVGAWIADTARGVVAFYDIDTPVTIAKVERGDDEYLSRDLVPRYDLYLSFTGGPLLERIEREYGVHARPLYCAVDADAYRPLETELRWDLGYLGTYSDDRQPVVDLLLVEPARRLPDARFVVAGPQYPDGIVWPANVERVDHLPPAEHARFYSAQRFTLNVTRAEMVRWGWSPSVRLFEAAACATPVISDWWDGLDAFFVPGREILVAAGAEELVRHLTRVDDDERHAIGERARRRILAEHTADRRAAQLAQYVAEVAPVRAR